MKTLKEFIDNEITGFENELQSANFNKQQELKDKIKNLNDLKKDKQFDELSEIFKKMPEVNIFLRQQNCYIGNAFMVYEDMEDFLNTLNSKKNNVKNCKRLLTKNKNSKKFLSIHRNKNKNEIKDTILFESNLIKHYEKFLSDEKNIEKYKVWSNFMSLSVAMFAKYKISYIINNLSSEIKSVNN